MKSKKEIEEQVEAAMPCLDSLQPATANPFLFTPIEQRLANKYATETYGRKMFSLALAIILFIVINVFSYERLTNSNSSASSVANGLEAFASDYDLSENSTNTN
jgi:hypothetical protein